MPRAYVLVAIDTPEGVDANKLSKMIAASSNFAETLNKWTQALARTPFAVNWINIKPISERDVVDLQADLIDKNDIDRGYLGDKSGPKGSERKEVKKVVSLRSRFIDLFTFG